MTLIGIDTALRCTGYGVLRASGKQFEIVDCGVIKNKPKDPLSECLRRLSGGMRELVATFTPDIAVIEGGFFARNAKTSMVLGMARGAVVAAFADAQVPTYEYAPRRVKQAVVGHGNASKDQVATTLARTLGINVSLIPDDATDGIAIALCHLLIQQSADGMFLPDPL